MKKLALIFIILLAAFLRLYNLSDFPAGLNADEAALGYNAYSLLLTGKDEHGHPWPVNLESFGDFKPAGYSYLLIPFIQIFGLTEFAVRLPSALFGILAVYFIYKLSKEIFSENMGLISALVLAVSPWHLHFSRGAWEVNVATTLILISVWLFVNWLHHEKFKWLGLSILGFVLSMYFYQSARIIAPLLGVGLSIIYSRKFIKRPSSILSSLVLVGISLFPLILSLVSSDASSRLSGVGLMADEGPLRRVEQLRGQHTNWSSPISRLLHNRPVIYTIQFLSNYLDHFQGDFLFITGDEIPRSRVPEMGQFYLLDLFLLALGLVFFIRSNLPNLSSSSINLKPVVGLWLLVAPIAAALTFQTPHALRSHSLVIPMVILISLGISQIIKHLKFVGTFILVLLYVWQVARYSHQYYIHYPQAHPSAWEYGFKELVSYVHFVKDDYAQILVTDYYDQPYILFLFYSKYPPSLFQSNHSLTLRDRFNFSTVRDYSNFHFESTPWEKVRDIHDALIIAAPQDIPEVGVNVVKTISFPNGDPAFKIISN